MPNPSTPSTSLPAARRFWFAALVLALVSALGLSLTASMASAVPPATLIGHVDSITASGRSVVVSGWLADRTASSSTRLHVAVIAGSQSVSWLANQSRPDVAAVYPTLGPLHGYSIGIDDADVGTYPVCVYYQAETGRLVSRLACATLTVQPDVLPIGHFDTAGPSGNAHVLVTGWALDPNTPTIPIRVNVYVGGLPAGGAFTATSALANGSRPDVATVYPSAGPQHGFAVNIAARPGTYPVCVYAINTYTYGAARLLGCPVVTV